MNHEVTLRPEYLNSNHGRIASFLFLADSRPSNGGAALIVPPLAEEMNKCRRMMSMQARRLAAQGVATAIVDLSGTGDSDGEFRQATWEGWLHDLDVGVRHLLEASGAERVALVGIRLGARLALDLASRRPDTDSAVLWQPVLSGQQHINHLLRTRIAAEIWAGGGEKETTRSLMKRLNAGETLDVGGYELSGDLASSVGRVALGDAPLHPGFSLLWIDDATPAPGSNDPSAAAIAKLAAAGASIRRESLATDPFWATTEVTLSEAWLDLTTGWISGSQR